MLTPNPTPIDIDVNLDIELPWLFNKSNLKFVTSGVSFMISFNKVVVVDIDVCPVPEIFEDFELKIGAPGYWSEPPIIKCDPNLPLYKLLFLFGNI